MIRGPHPLVKSEGLGQPQPQGGEQHALCSSSGKQAQIPPTECRPHGVAYELVCGAPLTQSTGHPVAGWQ